MAEHAKVTSLEALESFRTALVIYLEKALRTVDEISDEVKRTRIWLEGDRLVHWKGEVRRCTRNLEMKQQELFSARIGGLQEPTHAHQAAVRKARQALESATEKLDAVRHWNREFDPRVEPLARHADGVRHTLKVDMAKGLAELTQALEALQRYADLQAPGSPSSKMPALESPPSSGPGNTGGSGE